MIIYSKYNSYRKKEFQLITTIERENGIIFVSKIANNKKAEPFLLSFFEKFDYLKRNNFPFKLANFKKVNGKKIKFEYIEGDTLDNLLFESLQKLDKDEFIQLIKKYAKLIKGIGIKKDCNPSNDFNRIFGGKKNLKFDCVQTGCIDLNFDNIILEDNGKFCVVDYEWTFNFPLPYKYIIFRALTTFYSNYYVYNINAYLLPLSRTYSILGITKKERDQFIEFEYNFQKYVGDLFGISLEKFCKNYDNIENSVSSLNYFQQKNQAIQQKESEIQQKNQAIRQRGKEINMMKSSKFWKMRNGYINLKTKLGIK